MRISIEIPNELLVYIDELPGNSRSEKIATIIRELQDRYADDDRRQLGDWTAPYREEYSQ